jgi:hypothetical protein
MTAHDAESHLDRHNLFQAFIFNLTGAPLASKGIGVRCMDWLGGKFFVRSRYFTSIVKDDAYRRFHAGFQLTGESENGRAARGSRD